MGRLIDADAAIESLTEYGNGRAVYIGVEEAVRRIEQLPSAQPEPCEDAVSREAVLSMIDTYMNKSVELHYLPTSDGIKKLISILPSAQPERIKGHWIAITSWNNTYKCSVCGRLLVNITDGKNKVAKNYPYCHCGADMRPTERNSNV